MSIPRTAPEDSTQKLPISDFLTIAQLKNAGTPSICLEEERQKLESPASPFGRLETHRRLRRIAGNPNATINTLRQLFRNHPARVIQNSCWHFLLLENPGLVEDWWSAFTKSDASRFCDEQDENELIVALSKPKVLDVWPIQFLRHAAKAPNRYGWLRPYIESAWEHPACESLDDPDLSGACGPAIHKLLQSSSIISNLFQSLHLAVLPQLIARGIEDIVNQGDQRTQKSAQIIRTYLLHQNYGVPGLRFVPYEDDKFDDFEYLNGRGVGRSKKYRRRAIPIQRRNLATSRSRRALR